MPRKEVLEFIVDQVRILKGKHVADLMKENRVDELWKIAQQIEILPLLKFFNGEKRLNLKMCEIPIGCHYELAFYISQSTIFDHEIFENYYEFIELLRKTQEHLAERIAGIMVKRNLCDYTIPELLDGKLKFEEE